ncbi:hypothetical protein BU14_1626s0002 [Porphyra umbilicalis]|uniref:Uncharacterized protein n=1 Tax=Porphyra umbilicalis TaxID=2786 RepID=A0A1X6NLV0_PORUM|nr:hypothetical protein BU14_1626s0002 [Porphyra umbilicalis]|eukprot:OSX69313.1 hypothetical protein BU14_1626s0002 [Porphyra umbilicalis]
MTIPRVGVSLTIFVLSVWSTVSPFVAKHTTGAQVWCRLPLSWYVWMLFTVLSVWECELDALSLNLLTLTILMAVLLPAFSAPDRRPAMDWAVRSVDVVAVTLFAMVVPYVGDGRLISSLGPDTCTVGDIDVPFVTMFTRISWLHVVRSGVILSLIAVASITTLVVPSAADEDDPEEQPSMLTTVSDVFRLAALAGACAVLFAWTPPLDTSRPQNLMVLFSAVRTRDWWVFVGAAATEAITTAVFVATVDRRARARRVTFAEWVESVEDEE